MKKVMKRVLIPAAVIAVLSVASPAFAIHHSNLPADDCAPFFSQVLGQGTLAEDKANLGRSNAKLAQHNNADPPCADPFD
jgi:hypothetical protein